MHRPTLAAILALGLFAVSCNLQPLEDPGIGDLGLTTVVYAADGSVLAEWHAEENRVLASYDELPRHLIDAVVAIEDERFWQHPGVDLQGVARALAANLESGEVLQGGSTITQQYLKNVLLTAETTVDRKLTEAALALRLEEGLSKEEILERYFNTVYFGGGAYGVGVAAAHYFGKKVQDLTVAESALLAGLIRSPSVTDPYRAPEAAAERRRVVLNKMVELGWLDRAAAEEADAEPLRLAPPRPPEHARYPYFTEEVKRRLLDDPALGATPTDRYNALFRGGLRIHTTIDPHTQESAEAAVAAVLQEDGPSAAVAAVDPRTGYVLALVGGRDFYAEDDPVAQYNLATQGHRQPGSAFKPFVLAAALEEGIGLNDVIPAGRTVSIATSSGPWQVENYGGATFPDMSVLEGTVFSVNVVYARLMDRVGPVRVMDLARAAGIASPLQPFHALALGAQEVTPLELASAFGTFAAEGINIQPILVTSIENSEGVNVWEAVPVVTEAMPREVAQRVTAALTEVVQRGTGSQARIGRPVAGKTGTSQEHRDAWFVGYTPEMAASVWVGYPEGLIEMVPPATPFTVTGGTWPAQIWAAFAASALDSTSYGRLATVDEQGLVSVEVDLSTGFLAGPFCPRQHVQSLRLPAESVPTVVCPIHNPQGVVEAGSGVVPDVIGRDLGSAASTLVADGFEARVEWVDGGGLPQGTVFNQLPSPGFPAQVGTLVILTVAGPEPGSVVPGLLGFPADHAVSELDGLGMSAQVVIEAESDPDDAARRPGVVWKQDPAPGTPPAGPVVLWVNP